MDRITFWTDDPCFRDKRIRVYVADEKEFCSPSNFTRASEQAQPIAQKLYKRFSDIPRYLPPERHIYFIPANEDWDCNELEAAYCTVHKKRSREEIERDWLMSLPPGILK